MKPLLLLAALGLVGLPVSPARAAESALRLDHVTIFVPDLTRAKANFTRLGFTVHPGGTLPGGFDHNAIIPFDDGTYIELFAPTKPGFLEELRGLAREGQLGQVTRGLDAIARRFVEQQADGPGLGEFALSPTRSTIPEALAAMRARGLVASGPMPMVRTFENGTSIRWQIGVPAAGGLPFLISRTPAKMQSRRLSGPPPYRHANGATGISRVIVATPELAPALLAYRQLLGTLPAKPTEPIPGARSAAFPLPSGSTITLAQPTADEGELARHLRDRGAGIFAIEVTTTKSAAAKLLDRKRTEGARITLVPAH